MHTDPVLATLSVRDTGLPIYLQIRDQLLRAIASGMIPPGQQMPTMRQVAVSLKVDLNTVKHAFEALDAAGAIVTVPRRGTFAAERPPAVDPGVAAERADALAHALVAQATALAVDPAAVARRILEIVQAEETER